MDKLDLALNNLKGLICYKTSFIILSIFEMAMILFIFEQRARSVFTD